MVHRLFGKTGWRVSPVGLGCWQFGGAITIDGKPDGWAGISDEESLATIHRAVELGINFYDTADMYGWGHSEEILGQALKSAKSSNVHNPIYVATKVGYWHDAEYRRTFNESRDYIVAACDASLRRLQRDHIDLYQCHLWRTERWPEFLDAFETLQKLGKIRYFGISTNEFDMVKRFDERRDLAAVQCNYNLLDRHAEKEILPYCRARGIAFIARGPLARGKLAGKIDKTTKFAPDDIRNNWLTPENRAAFERDIDIVERLKPIAHKSGFILSELAIKAVLNHVAVSVAIVGTKTRAQLEHNIAASILPPFTHEELAAIEQALV
jgi:myo-inositol catabolism protein IolS